MIYLMVALFALLIAAGALRAWPNLLLPWRLRLLRAIALVAGLGAAGLLAYRDGSFLLLGSIPWLEEGILGLDETGARLGALAIGGYALYLWQSLDLSSADWWQALASPVLLAASFAALNVNHFVYRYIFLELAALATLLLVVRRHDWRDLPHSFLVLRLGDLALLGAIILLWQAHGTLLISPLLNAAALAADGTTLWALLLGLLAVWIKLGLYPFDGWLAAAARTTGPERWAGAAIGMPLLGAYLLYRLESSVHALALEPYLVALGGVVLVVALARALWAHDTARGHHLRVAHDALALVAVPMGYQYLYLYSFVPLRALLIASSPVVEGELAEKEPETVAEPLPGWKRLAGVARLFEERVLTGAERSLASLAEGAANLARVVDRDFLERGATAASRSVLEAGRHLRRLHTGRLRANLAWMAGLVVLILSLAVILTLI